MIILKPLEDIYLLTVLTTFETQCIAIKTGFPTRMPILPCKPHFMFLLTFLCTEITVDYKIGIKFDIKNGGKEMTLELCNLRLLRDNFCIQRYELQNI